MPEAMALIRAELGKEAVILKSKEIESGGFLGFFTRKKLEVIAAIDQETKGSPGNSVKKRPVGKQKLPQPSQKEGSGELVKEIDQLKAMIQELAEKKQSGAKEYPEPFQQVDEHLKQHGVSHSVRLSLLKRLLSNWYNENLAERSGSKVKEQLIAELTERLEPYPFGGVSLQKKVVQIVGPTGVGKTTTIAKIAADCVLNKHKKK